MSKHPTVDSLATITIKTQDGEEYKFAVNDVELTIDADTEELWGRSGEVATRLTQRHWHLDGEILCTKSP